MAQTKQYEFIHEALFFPGQGILVIGDLHIGYENMLRESGILVPERQTKETIDNIKKILDELGSQRKKVNKIIFLGDIKHAFSYEFQEKNEFHQVLNFLKKIIPEKDIILIKGNHDTMDYTGNKAMKDYHVELDSDGSGIAFVHGHRVFPEIFDKNIKMVVSGHLHPSVILAEKPGVKREEFKCFLEGSYRGKVFIIVPSFFGIIEGTPVNEYNEYYWEDFSIFPQKAVLNAKIYVVGQDKIYEFGKVKDL